MAAPERIEMTQDNGRDPSGQALVSDQAPAHLHPSGFDPSRVEGEEYRLSNGLRLYIGKFVGAAERNNVALLERFIATGHALAVSDWTDDTDSVDVFFTSGGYCNGPGCAACHDSDCWHCDPDYEPKPCVGADGYAAEQKAARHRKFLELKAEFESASAIEARSGETRQGLDPEGTKARPEGDAQSQPATPSKDTQDHD
jgi:hypothetical protein